MLGGGDDDDDVEVVDGDENLDEVEAEDLDVHWQFGFRPG